MPLPITGWNSVQIYHCGKNLLNSSKIRKDNYFYKANGTLEYNKGWYLSEIVPVYPNTTYTLQTGHYSTQAAVRFLTINKKGCSTPAQAYDGETTTFTTPEDCYFISASLFKGAEANVQLEIGSNASTVEPYPDDIYSVTFSTEAGAVTVYAGILTINENGTEELRVRPYYTSYNGETLIGPWISSMDIYVEEAIPTIGAQVVDLGGIETVYQLTNQQIFTTLLGTNNIWADCGDITAIVSNNESTYTRKKLASVFNLLNSQDITDALGYIPPVTDTTYLAGTGLSLSGTTFNHNNSIIAGTVEDEGGTRVLTFGETFKIPSVAYDEQGHITSTSTITLTMPANPDTNTASAIDNILHGSNSGTAITYAPYTEQEDKLSFDTSDDDPIRDDRLNLNGHLHATKLYSGGQEVLTEHQSLKDYKTKQTAVSESDATNKIDPATRFVSLITQDNNGVISVETHPLPLYNYYSLPLAENGIRGGIQIGFEESENENNYAVQLDNEKAYVTVPWTDTKVTQKNSAENVDYRVLLSNNANDTEEVNITNKSANLIFNPSTKVLSVGGSITATGNLTIIGNTNLNNETYVNSLTTDSLLVTGNTNFIQIPTAPTPTDDSNDTSIATTAFVKNAFIANDAMIYKGILDGGNSLESTIYTPAAEAGWTYKVATAGYINGIEVEIGDTFICLQNNTVTATSANINDIKPKWNILQTNIDGSVIGPSESASGIAIFTGNTGKAIKDSGVLLNQLSVFKGAISGNMFLSSATYTPEAKQGDTYRVDQYGYINQQLFGKNDILICINDTDAGTAENISTIQNNWVRICDNYTINNDIFQDHQPLVCYKRKNDIQNSPYSGDGKLYTTYTIGNLKTWTVDKIEEFSDIYWATYGTSTIDDMRQAFQEKRHILIRYNDRLYSYTNNYNPPGAFGFGMIDMPSSGTGETYSKPKDKNINFNRIINFGCIEIDKDTNEAIYYQITCAGYAYNSETQEWDIVDPAIWSNTSFNLSIANKANLTTTTGSVAYYSDTSGTFASDGNFKWDSNNQILTAAKLNGYVVAGQKAESNLGDNATAEGCDTIASGKYSHAEGYNTIANHASQHVFGEYNLSETFVEDPTTEATEKGNYIEIVGNGTADARSNARTLDWDGNETISGNLTIANKVSLVFNSATNALDFVFA